MTTTPTTGLPPQPPHRWSLSTRIAAAYWLLVGLILVLYFEELIGEFGSDLWQAATDWVAQNQLRAIEVASLLGGLLAISIGVVGLRIVGYFRRRREQQLARVDPKDRPKFESDLSSGRLQVITTIAQIGGGAALLVGIYFTYQNLIATREGQVTDRFIRAVDQLGAKDKDGNPAPEIRRGGVYGLRRIAQDSREDYKPIRRILNDYIMINAPWSDTDIAVRGFSHLPQKVHLSAGPIPTAAETPAPVARPSPPVAVSAPAALMAPPRADIQAALDFLIQPIPEYEKLSASDPVNLPGADLRRAVLNEPHLEKAILIGVHLEYAQLNGAHLEGASLFGAHLDLAHLEGAFLEGASLFGAHLTDAVLNRAHLECADLGSTHLKCADLGGASLVGAWLMDAHLDGASLGYARLEYAHLDHAHLDHASLYGAHLEGTTLNGADLDGAHLDEAWLNGADLSKTLGLTKEQIASAHGDAATKLPPKLEPYRPASWKK